MNCDTVGRAIERIRTGFVAPAFKAVRSNDAKEQNRVTVGEAVQWAEEHLFDRNSVVLECQLWQEALGRARGESFSVSELKDFTQRRGYIRDEARPGEVTLREVLLREWEIVQTAKEGVGDCLPLVANPRPVNPQLDDEQRQALECLACVRQTAFRSFAAVRARAKALSCANWSSNCDSQAGAWSSSPRNVSKSWTWRRPDFRRQRRSPVFSPRVNLLTAPSIVVDEAGQIGGRQMLELVRLVHERNGRLVLSGDTRQHGAVEASDALLAIERHAGVKPVELHKIRRQDPALGRDVEERKRIRLYRKAVEAAAAGKLGESFERLDKMGAVVACGMGEQADKLADEYLRLAEQNASAVVVSQTWGEVHRVNSRVRDALKAKGIARRGRLDGSSAGKNRPHQRAKAR